MKFIAIFFLILIWGIFSPNTIFAAGTWEVKGSQIAVHNNTPTAVLQNGKVLMISGIDATVESYNETTELWEFDSNVNDVRTAYNPVVLDNGKVLIAGGQTPFTDDALSSAELYDPVTHQWTYTGSLNTARRCTNFIKLQNGKVLAISGADTDFTPIMTTELYDPATGQWSYTGDVLFPIWACNGESVTLLDDGRVLVIGKFLETLNTQTQLYEPTTGQWTAGGDMVEPRTQAPLITLQNGKALVIGGNQWGSGAIDGTELFDPTTNQWTATGSMHVNRATANAVLFSDGKAFVAGGEHFGVPEPTSEIYDPATGQWTVDASLNHPRHNAKLAPLTNGDMLLTGGLDQNGFTTVTEVYSLPDPITTTFNSSMDTYLRNGAGNRNTGAGTFMTLQASGNNRSLVRFDQTELQEEIGTNKVLSAKLLVTITDNSNNWGSTGRPIDVHRLLINWTEGNGTETNRGTGAGATWECAVDTNITNILKNCSGTTEWEMGQPNNPSVHPWNQIATATQTITNNQSGVVEFDVTNDVTDFLSGTNQNYGWLIKKTNEGLPGQISFGTRESTFDPQLVVTYQPE